MGGDERDERPTVSIRRFERPDSTRPTTAMLPLDSEREAGEAAPALDGYVIDTEIGRGGMGTVFAATTAAGERVAIKVLTFAMCGDPIALDRLLREARMINAIRHPNIVDIHDFGTAHDGRHYLVMELLEGETLKARLARGPLPLEDGARVIDACASALLAVHARGFIHRDFKPDNIFLLAGDGPPRVKLVDFGIVKVVGEAAQTRTGALVGTTGYASPEQIRGGKLDHRTDIYALGVTSFELLSGTRPLSRDNPLETMIAHVKDPVPSLVSAGIKIPRQLAAIVEAMMAKSPGDRPTLTSVRATTRWILDARGAPLADEPTEMTQVPVAPQALPGMPLAESPTEPTEQEPPEQEPTEIDVEDILDAAPIEAPRADAAPIEAPRADAAPIEAPRADAGDWAAAPAVWQAVPRPIDPQIGVATEAVRALPAPAPQPSIWWLVFAIALVVVTSGLICAIVLST